MLVGPSRQGASEMRSADLLILKIIKGLRQEVLKMLKAVIKVLNSKRLSMMQAEYGRLKPPTVLQV